MNVSPILYKIIMETMPVTVFDEWFVSVDTELIELTARPN